MSHIRSIKSLSLSTTTIQALTKHGYRTVDDLIGVQPMDLQEDCSLHPAEAVEVIRALQALNSHSQSTDSTETVASSSIAEGTGIGSETISMKDALAKTAKDVPIITFCKAMDNMLGGGIPMGQITEFCGVPGIGKIPQTLYGGCGGQSIYIDTEGSFMIERVVEMATALSTHLSALAMNKIPAASEHRQQILKDITVDKLLQGINVTRIHDQTEFLAVINHLHAYVRANNQIKLIVVDSIAFPFRQALQDSMARTRILAGIAQRLNELAYQHNVAVVLVNHVTTRFEPISISAGYGYAIGMNPNENNIARIIPALGEQWSHCVTNRVMLHWGSTVLSNERNSNFDGSNGHVDSSERIRVATLVKSPSRPCSSSNYQVNELGIRDVIQAIQAIDPSNKRQRLNP